MPPAFTASDEQLEKIVCAILMHEVGARNELLVRYPNFAETLSIRDARRLAEICLGAQGRITPSAAESMSVGYDWTWNLQSVYDTFSVEDVRMFTVHVDRILSLWKQRQLALYVNRLEPILQKEVTGMDRLMAEFIERISGIGRQLSSIGDPSARARLEQVEANLRAGIKLNLTKVDIAAIDNSVGGVDLDGRDYWVIEGLEKSGKTRLIINIVANLFRKLGSNLRCCWISTESAFTPEKLMAMFVAMNATKLAIANGEFGLALSQRQYLTGEHVGQPMERYVKQAVEEVSGWPLRVYGPGKRDGSSRLISNALGIAAMEIDVRGANLIVLDNYQQLVLSPDSYHNLDGGNLHYRIMSEVVPRFSELVALRGVAHFAISQLGRSGGTLGYSGLGYEANVNMRVVRDDNEPVNSFLLEATKVRDGPCFKEHIVWEPLSGLIVGAN